MDEVNRKRLPNDLRLRVRRFFYQSRELQVSRSYQVLLEQMSPELQQQVARSMNDKWLQQIWWISGTSDSFVASIAKGLMPLLFSPSERVDPLLSRLQTKQVMGQRMQVPMLGNVPAMYILSRGVASRDGQVLTIGDVWGEDCALANPIL